MIGHVRWAMLALGAAAAMALAPARAATPQEEALEAAQALSRAIMAQDVDAQMKLLPPTMYARPGERDRVRAQKLHDKEVAIVNKQKYLSFEVKAPVQTLKVNAFTAVVVPYRSVLAEADGKLQVDSVIIALTDEASGKWSAFDGSGQVTRTLKVIIPGYTQGLVVPPVASKLIKGE